MFVGECFWEHPPTPAEIAAAWPGITAEDHYDLPGLIDLAIMAGFRPEWIETASLEEWDDFESGSMADAEEWLADHHGSPAGRRDQEDGRRPPVRLAPRIPRAPGSGLPHPYSAAVTPQARRSARSAARLGYTRPVAHTAHPGLAPAASPRHDPISTSSTWLAEIRWNPAPLADIKHGVRGIRAVVLRARQPRRGVHRVRPGRVPFAAARGPGTARLAGGRRGRAAGHPAAHLPAVGAGQAGAAGLREDRAGERLP